MEQPVTGNTHTASQKLTQFNDRMRRYAKLIVRRWWLIMLLVSCGVCLQAWKTSKLPDQYRSSARVVVTGQLALKDSVHYREEMANFYGTQAQILDSSELKRRVRERVKVLHPGMKPSGVSLTIERQKNSSVFNLDSLGQDPLYTRAYLEALLDEYINFRKEMRARVSENTLDAFTEELARTQKRLQVSEAALKDFENSNNVVVLEEGRNSSATFVQGLKSRIADLRTELSLLRRLDIEQDILRRNRFPETGEGAGTNVLPLADAERDFLETRQKIELLHSELDQFLVVLKDKHPKVQALRQQITKAEKLLSIYRRQAEEQNAQRIKSLEVEIANLGSEMETWEAKALTTSVKLGDYRGLLAQVDRDRTSYERLLHSMHDVDRSQNLNQDSVAVMERATAAILVKRDRVAPLAVGAFLGGFIALGLLFGMDRLDDRLRSASEFTVNFHEELLGVIPVLPGKSRIAPLESHDERHMFSEAYRNLRSSLLFKNWHGKEPRKILITSAVPMEGKTTVATNLAITMALAGSRVLLIDADLRRGSLIKFFDIPEGRGLGDIIARKAKLEQCVVETRYEKLSLLGRGCDLPPRSENFLGAQMRGCVQAAVAAYDYVIIDSAPVLVADDTTTLAPLADTTLFVMRINATPARLAERALERLYNRQVVVGGVVLNCEHLSSSDYRSYGYYKYYSSPNRDSGNQTANVRRRGAGIGLGRRPKQRSAVTDGVDQEENSADEIYAE